MSKNVTLFTTTLDEAAVGLFTILNVVFAQIAPTFQPEPMIYLFPKIYEFTSSSPNASDDAVASFLGSKASDVAKLRKVLDQQYLGIGFDDAVAQSAVAAGKVPHFDYVNYVPLAAVGIAITSILMALRFYSRSKTVTTKERIMAHDWVMLVAWVMTVMWEISALAQARIPDIFKQSYDLTYRNFQLGQVFSFSLIVTYPIVLLLPKTSILLFYGSIFPRHTSKRFHYFLYLTFTIALLSSICQSLGCMFSCIPVDAWNDYLDAVCAFDWQLTARYTTIVNILNDLMILLIPIPIVWKLRMSIQERLLVLATLGLGSASCVASAIRLYFLVKEQTLGTDHCFIMNLCSMVELNVAIICSCAPSMRLLIGKYWPRLLGTRPVKSKRVSRILAMAGGAAILENLDDGASEKRRSIPPSDQRSSMQPIVDHHDGDTRRGVNVERNMSGETIV